MNIKKVLATTIIASALLISAVAVSAHGNGNSRGGRGFGEFALVETYTGLSAQDLRDAFESGSTLAELIEANGQSVDEFITETRTALEERLNEALEEGRIDEAIVTERLATFDENIDERLNTVPELRDGNTRGGRGFLAGDLLETYTGLTAEELRDAFENGSTPAELIVANGQSVDAFIVEARASLETNLDESATERLANFDENIEDHLNTVPQLGDGNGPGHHGGRGNRNGG